MTDSDYDIIPFKYNEAAKSDCYAIQDRQTKNFWPFSYSSELVAQAIIARIKRTHAMDVTQGKQSKPTPQDTTFANITVGELTRNG